jgi:hypothetical protein
MQQWTVIATITTRHDHDSSELSDIELRVRALESILVEKAYIDPAAVDALTLL